MHFEIHSRAKRMARHACEILLLALWGGLGVVPGMRAQAAPPQAMPGGSGTPAPRDLSQIESDALHWLQDLIGINTVNPPGNELVAAKYIAAILEKEGIHTEIFESAPGRGFMVARLSASALPDPSRALLLLGHLDVVGVDKAKWSVDPFGAA